MSRLEFMQELESLLSDIPIDERQEALQYYNDYFEDAGEENEEDVIKQLESPSRIAGIIKADLSANVSEQETRGVFTEKGYQDTLYRDPKFEIVDVELNEDQNKKEQKAKEQSTNNYRSANNYYDTNNSANQTKSNNETTNKSARIALIVILCIFAIPIGLPMIIAVFSVIFSVAMAVLGMFIGFGISGIAMVAAGIALVVFGLFKLIAVPLLGMLLCGSGLLLLGVGILFIMFSVLLLKTVLPAIIRGFVALCRLPFKNRSVMA